MLVAEGVALPAGTFESPGAVEALLGELESPLSMLQGRLELELMPESFDPLRVHLAREELLTQFAANLERSPFRPHDVVLLDGLGLLHRIGETLLDEDLRACLPALAHLSVLERQVGQEDQSLGHKVGLTDERCREVVIRLQARHANFLKIELAQRDFGLRPLQLLATLFHLHLARARSLVEGFHAIVGLRRELDGLLRHLHVEGVLGDKVFIGLGRRSGGGSEEERKEQLHGSDPTLTSEQQRDQTYAFDESQVGVRWRRPMIPALLLTLTGELPLDERFETEVRPLLHRHCVECHGPDESKAGLRLDGPDGLRLGSDSGEILVPGDPANSRIVQVTSYTDPHVQMPPDGKLSEEELQVLHDWIEAGAPMPEGSGEVARKEFDLEARLDHWSFQPIASPAAPADPTGWATASVDGFVAEVLASNGLEPAPETERLTWLRRVTFQLTGLPPTVEEARAFLADDRAGAYERVVDRLLHTEAYGETWARHWLDLMRYAETKGHEFDYAIPNAWRYRDYVVRAFDEDVAYDDFVMEHLAGDLLDAPRLAEDGSNESILGTGWWWLGDEMHSPVDIRGDETDRVADQVDVMTKAFLGLTVACARCHDHKFDPISQKDYYALCGFALSSPYAQVRYESRETNRFIAAKLGALRARSEVAVRRAVGEEALADLERFEEIIEAALEANEMEPLVSFSPSFAPPVERQYDLILEDFEGDDWAPWTASGDAFGERPIRLDEVRDDHKNCGAFGQGLISTLNGLKDGERIHTDELTGQLLSPEYVATRKWLHLKVGGGRQPEKAEVRLLVDGEVVARLTGENRIGMREARFDLRPYQDQSFRIEIIDEHTGGWGHISVDHLVLSDRETGAALRRAEHAHVHQKRSFVARNAARTRSLDPGRVRQVMDLLREADESSPLAALAGKTPRSQRPLELPEDYRIHADYRQSSGTPVKTDGPAWIHVEAGGVRLSSSESRPITGIEPIGAAVTDPAWSGLRTIESGRDPGRLNYDRAGRTLYTPSFELTGGKLFCLIRGRGRLYAAVDSHKLVQGPLHGSLVRNVDAPDEYKWVEVNLTRYAGHRLHLEFSPREGEELAVACVLEATQAPSGSPEPFYTGSDLASVAEELRAGAQAVIEGEIAPGIDWITGTWWAHGAPASLVTRTASYRSAEARTLAEASLASRTSPGLVDGFAVNERLLMRGSPRAATEPVPRAFLTASGLGPIETEGSGRLELAMQMVDPDNPFVSRAWVNRVWRHLFGRGIAPSADDLGVLGTGPKEYGPLLDHLARRFTGELRWSNKALLRELVLSSTYRQASGDYAHEQFQGMPVRPLSAEALRDAILAVSGELDRKRFGPPVPIHLTDFLQGRGRPGSGPLDGHGRRSIYLSVRRNFLDPFLLAFDFPVPSDSRAMRANSNVPAQALTLLNDPFVHGQAERLAQRMLDSEGSNDEVVRSLFERTLGRPAEPSEVEALVELLEADGDRRRALTDLIHVLFNLKEFRHLR